MKEKGGKEKGRKKERVNRKKGWEEERKKR